MVSQLTGEVMSVTETVYYAHESGQQIEIDSLAEKARVEYNNLGFKSKKTYFSQNDSLLYTAVGGFDKKGRRIKLEGYNSSGDLLDIATSKYNAKGLEKERSVYNIADDAIIEVVKFKYDQRYGCVYEEHLDENGRLYSNVIYKFDSTHKSSSREEFFGTDKGILTNYKFLEYDKVGNWVKKLEFENNVLVRVTERQIFYLKQPIY